MSARSLVVRARRQAEQAAQPGVAQQSALSAPADDDLAPAPLPADLNKLTKLPKVRWAVSGAPRTPQDARL